MKTRDNPHISDVLLFWLLFSVLCLLNIGFAQEEASVTAEATFDKSEITIGDKVKYAVTVEVDKDTKIDFPVIDSMLIGQGFTIRDFGQEKPVKISRHRVRRKYWYLLDTYVTGSYTIPPAVIKYALPDGTEGETETQEVFLEVKSVIKEGEEPQDIRDIKIPVEIKISYKNVIIWSTLILLFVLGLGTGILLYFKYRHIIKPPPLPIPAHVIALRDLEKARGMSLENEGKIKEYYISVSGIIRRYIEKRFGLHAPERTTEEFLTELTVTDTLNQTHKGLLRDFLKHCDLVKFAKYGPTKNEIDGAYKTGRRFVKETKPIEESSS